MSIKFVQFKDSTEAAIICVFGCPQDPEAWPNQGEVEESDVRYVAFLESLKPEPATEALRLRDEKLRAAAIRISPLQDAVDLNKATEAEGQALIAWKEYRVDLNRLQEQPGFPNEINWPTSPDTETAQ